MNRQYIVDFVRRSPLVVRVSEGDAGDTIIFRPQRDGEGVGRIAGPVFLAGHKPSGAVYMVPCHVISNVASGSGDGSGWVSFASVKLSETITDEPGLTVAELVDQSSGWKGSVNFLISVEAKP